MNLFRVYRAIEKGPLRLVAAVRRLAAGGEGAILAEAALVIPVLLLLLVAMVEFTQAFAVRRRTAAVAATTADLVSQAVSISTSDLNDIVSAANNLMPPYSVTPLTVTITSVQLAQNPNQDTANNQVTANWSCSWSSISAAPVCSGANTPYSDCGANRNTGAPDCPVSSTSLPPGLLGSGNDPNNPSVTYGTGTGQCIIIVQTSYLFAPTVGRFLLHGVTFNQTSYFAPRNTACVQKT